MIKINTVHECYLTLQCFVISLHGKLKLRCSAKHLYLLPVPKQHEGEWMCNLSFLDELLEEICSACVTHTAREISTTPTINTSTAMTRPGAAPSRSILLSQTSETWRSGPGTLQEPSRLIELLHQSRPRACYTTSGPSCQVFSSSDLLKHQSQK